MFFLLYCLDSRVHFDGLLPVDSDEETHPILVQDLSEEHHRTVGVYLGFLQEDHKYEVIFKIPMELLHGFLSTKMDGLCVQAPATNCTVKRMHSPGGEYLELVVGLEVRHGSYFEDNFTIQSEEEPSRFVHVKISAQILGSVGAFHFLIYMITRRMSI